MSIIEKVVHFNQAIIGISCRPKDTLMESEDVWLVGALNEEITEFTDAKTYVHQVDALADLVYFALGGMYRMGLSAQEIDKVLDAVHEANMTKKKGVKETRNYDLDAVKSDNWIPPEERFAQILGV